MLLARDLVHSFANGREIAVFHFAEKEQSLSDLRGRVAELERLLETDELTGLLNRRGFESAARRTLA